MRMRSNYRGLINHRVLTNYATLTMRPILIIGLAAGLVGGSVFAQTATAAEHVGAGPTVSPEPSSETSGPSLPLLRAQGVISTYTLVVPKSVAKSKLQTRAVIPNGSSCPKLVTTNADGLKKKHKMRIRAAGATTGAAFASVKVCQANIPRAATAAAVAKVRVPYALPKKIDKVVLLADTGCRLKGDTFQDCSSPTQWPLATVAKSVSAANPDLAMMLGDFFYREKECPNDKVDLCGGSPPPLHGAPFKDSGYGWIADALAPMAPMFATTPILAIRGNHEACDRGGNGYFLFMDASPLGPQACAPVNGVAERNITPSWAVDLPIKKGRTLRAVSVDTAYGDDIAISDWATTQATEYARAANLAKRKKGREAWMLTHRPIFGLVSTDYGTGDPTFSPWVSADQEAAAQGKLDNFDALMSSHIHLAQAVQLPGYPAQLVIGNGGTLLDPPTGYGIPPYGPLLDGQGNRMSPDYEPYPNAISQWTSVRFGFVVATPGAKAKAWKLSQRDPNGAKFAECSLKKRQVSCK